MGQSFDISNKEALLLLDRYKRTENPEVLGKLYEPYMEMVLAIGLKYYKDRVKAEDLVMNVYEKLVQKAKKHDISNFSSWLYSVAKNECLMDLRKKKREYATDDFSYQKQFMESAHVLHLFKENKKEKKLKALESCVEQLSEDQKVCIKKFYLENKTYKEIVNQTEYDYNKVKSHIQNGKRNLKICMEETNG